MRISEEEMQEVDKLNYLRVMIAMGDGIEEKVGHRVLEGRKVWETMAKL